jgi:molybdopterin-guanine dinucleotide biosynthesis protein A
MGQPKEWLRFGDEYLLERVVRVVGEVARPVVAAGRSGQELPKLPDGVTRVFDRPGQAGPLAGVAAGMAHLGDSCAAAVVVSCDVPLITAAFLRKLIHYLNDHPAVVPEHAGRLQSAIAVYRMSTRAMLEDLLASGERRMQAFVERCGTRVIPAELFRDVDPSLQSLINVNTPEEYHGAIAALETGHG